MLTEKEIQQALHAWRVVPLGVPSPHGPLGLEHLAGAVAQLAESPFAFSEGLRIARPIALTLPAWEKLQRLAESAAAAGSQPVTASQLATAILEQVLAKSPPT
ncbi:MAG TPA: hypothetical protein VEL76_33105 [Gemmataceae bacterium]|nr:hypothetical protein [Gemmataceae bacterium]